MFRLMTGDCRTSLRGISAGSVNTCITSPPYFGLRDYGAIEQIGLERTPVDFVRNLVETFKEVHRVLRDDGTLWLNLGDSYNNFRNHPSPFETKDGEGNLRGKPAAGSRVRGWTELKEKDLMGVPWRVAFALQAEGWYLRQEIIWEKPNSKPESVKDRFTKSHEHIFLFSKSQKYYFDQGSVKEQIEGKDTVRNKRSVWHVPTKPFRGAHFATFPADLIEPCVLAGSPIGGTVLDPFGGSGTTAGVALKHGRRAIICEVNPEYSKLMPSRIESISGMDLTAWGLI